MEGGGRALDQGGRPRDGSRPGSPLVTDQRCRAGGWSRKALVESEKNTNCRTIEEIL